VEYLGHIVSHDGVSVDPNKIEAMKDWPHLKTLKTLKKILAFTSYYSKFVRNYGKIPTSFSTLLIYLFLFSVGMMP